MTHNEEFVLYLMVVLGVAALLSSDDSTAWIGLIVLIAGTLFGFGLDLLLWFINREPRSKRKKKRDANGD